MIFFFFLLSFLLPLFLCLGPCHAVLFVEMPEYHFTEEEEEAAIISSYLLLYEGPETSGQASLVDEGRHSELLLRLCAVQPVLRVRYPYQYQTRSKSTRLNSSHLARSRMPSSA